MFAWRMVSCGVVEPMRFMKKGSGETSFKLKIASYKSLIARVLTVSKKEVSCDQGVCASIWRLDTTVRALPCRQARGRSEPLESPGLRARSRVTLIFRRVAREMLARRNELKASREIFRRRSRRKSRSLRYLSEALRHTEKVSWREAVEVYLKELKSG